MRKLTIIIIIGLLSGSASAQSPKQQTCGALATWVNAALLQRGSGNTKEQTLKNLLQDPAATGNMVEVITDLVNVTFDEVPPMSTIEEISATVSAFYTMCVSRE